MLLDSPVVLPELVLFDFAGTTLRDDGAVMAAFRNALTSHGIPFSEGELAARRGATKREVFRDLAGQPLRTVETDDLADRALADFETALRDEYSNGNVQPIEGARLTVRWLADRGVKIALASGFTRELVQLLLERLGWERLFDRVLAAEDVPVGRPAPYIIFRAMMDLGVYDLSRVAVVGDTPLDLEAGANAGAGWIIGVLTGDHGTETLGTTRHTHLLPSVADLPRLFDIRR
jgi:phosphonatase-like hydrolase